jgi:MarR family transcriptional regulator for hemolysin
MSKLNSNAVHEALEELEAVGDQRSGVFDDRGRTVPWMARTMYRLYDVQGQKLLDKEGISVAHWFYLRVLAERGEVNQLELSKRVGIASTTAVPALDSLEKRNLVRRTRDPKDRRKYYVSLLDEGKRLVDVMLPELTEMISASLESVSAKDLRVFWKVMRRIEDNLTQMSQGDSVID